MKQKNPEHSTREIHKVGFGDLMDKVSNLLVTDRLVKLLSFVEKRKRARIQGGKCIGKVAANLALFQPLGSLLRKEIYITENISHTLP